jgi:uncharacterized protein
MSERVFRLLERHQRLDMALRSEQSRRWPDFARLQQIKRLKLAVKDRLSALLRRSRAPLRD